MTDILATINRANPAPFLATTVGGWFGGVTLSDWSEIASIICSTIGALAGLLTIIVCLPKAWCVLRGEHGRDKVVEESRDTPES